MDWLDFSKYENAGSKFTAELSTKGGYITFSNSGKGGMRRKYFTLSLNSFLTCLKDIANNHSSFSGNESYNEDNWRDLGSSYFTDEAAHAQSTVQTKPLFTTLSKIIMWANAPKYDSNNPENTIVLGENDLKVAIEKLEALSDAFLPNLTPSKSLIDNRIILSSKALREFAKSVFTYFFGDDWNEVLSETSKNDSTIEGINFISHDYGILKRLISEFSFVQTKESLTSSNTQRYFDDPIYIKDGKYYYFTTQWNGNGDYSLSFENLKKVIEYKFPDFQLKNIDGLYILKKLEEVQCKPFNIDNFIDDLKRAGLIYTNKLVTSFVASLLTKPFVILTGLSGSGKTKLAQAFVQWICKDKSQYRIIPVGADWTNREPLLGYPNALKPHEYVKPDSGVLDLIIRANKTPDLPHFLILDEMNLSHVERYFADFLSVMESKKAIPLYAEGTVENGVPAKLKVPSNLFIIGTVNIDETTNMFSPKVLDRANTIEFRVSQDEMKAFLGKIKDLNMDSLTQKGADFAESFLEMSINKSFATADIETINKALIQFFGELKKTGAEFGYRSASEILRLIHQLTVLDNNLTTHQKIDIAIMQKLLPKLHGSRRKLTPVLETLGSFCVSSETRIVKDVFEKSDFDFNGSNVLYPISLEKIARMYHGAIDNGFASFAEA